MAKLPTMKVRDDNPRGWKIINASAFDPDVHEVYDPSKPAKPAPVKKARAK